MEYRYIDTGKTSRKRKHDDVTVGKSFAQLYSGAFRLFARISTPCAKDLFFWAIEKCDKWNHIAFNKAGRSAFIAEHFIASGHRYADETVKKAVKVLTDEGLCVSISEESKRSATYMINPYYVWKTKSRTDRYEVVKAYINILKDEGNQIR